MLFKWQYLELIEFLNQNLKFLNFRKISISSNSGKKTTHTYKQVRNGYIALYIPITVLERGTALA